MTDEARRAPAEEQQIATNEQPDENDAEEVVELPERSAMSVIGFGFGGGAVPDPDVIIPSSGDEMQGFPGEN